METKNRKLKVFISYSWDNEEHKSWVLEIADKLTKRGIYVFFDRYDLYAGKDMIYFMEESVKKSNKTLLIMTPNYKVKSEKRVGGVGFETSIVTAEIFNNQKSEKFIPILVGDRKKSTPDFIKTKIYIDMTDESEFDEKMEELIAAIHGKSNQERPPVEEPAESDTISTESGTIGTPSGKTKTSHQETNYKEDSLSAYLNYQGGPIPQIEMDKYHLSCESVEAQKRHDFLRVVQLKLELAKICKSQPGKEGDAYILEEGIRKAYIILSAADKKKAKVMISEYNSDMAKYIDEDIKRY